MEVVCGRKGVGIWGSKRKAKRMRTNELVDIFNGHYIRYTGISRLDWSINFKNVIHGTKYIEMQCLF
jgi:hypothetical protein